MKKHKSQIRTEFIGKWANKSVILIYLFVSLSLIQLMTFPAIARNHQSVLDFQESLNNKPVDEQQQNRKITGIVFDETGSALPGVSIKLKGGSTGTITDINGQFKLDIRADVSSITASYIGYIPQEMKISVSNEYKVTLLPDNRKLDELVVVGYGIQKKSNVTGAIASLKGEDLANLSNTNAASAIQGKVTGVQVVNGSGAPGASSDIRIRGYSSNGNSNPLYVVDGLKVPNIDFLEPENIKSIEILKDGASAAIYGAEAGNGVVLITTKSGKNEGKIFVNTQNSFSDIPNRIKLMNASEYSNFLLEAYPSRKNEMDAFYTNAPSAMINGKLADTNWQDAFFSTGYKQRYNVGFQGGNKDGALFVSLGYLDINGIITGNSDVYRKFSAQINGNYNIKKWLEVGMTASLNNAYAQKISEASNVYGATLSNLRTIDPLTPVEYQNGLAGASAFVQQSAQDGHFPIIDKSTGNYYGSSYWVATTNPLANLVNDSQYTKNLSANGTFFTNFKPIKNFIFTSRLGYRLDNVYEYRYIQPYWMNPTATSDNPYLDVSQKNTFYYQWENFANYSFDIKENHFSALGGMSFIQNQINFIGANTDKLQNTLPNYLYLDYSRTDANDKVFGRTIDNYQLAYYGRLSWDYADRYNLQLNFRADAYDAAYLDMNHSWGYFPSISGGWTITNEKFLKNINKQTLSYAKLRLSYGKNGNISNLAPYMYASRMLQGASGVQNSISYNYYMNNKLYAGTYPNSFLANSKLRWEESVQSNAGIDLRLFNDQLSFSVDYYNKNTDGLLVQTTSALTTGTSFEWKNLGLINNHGVEFEVGWKGNIAKDFKYSIKGNLATVSNKVDKYLGKGVRLQSSNSPMSYFEEGYPLWYLRGYKVKGIDTATGRATYDDISGDGQITNADQQYLGSGIPDFTYGLTISLNYKNFDLNVYGTGVQGNKIYYAQNREKGRNNLESFYLNRWTATNTAASLPSALYQLEDPNYVLSDAYVFDGSFFKIKQIQLGYNFPNKLINKFSISALRAYVSVENCFTFTKYPGLDPESRPQGDPSSMAVDMGGYPIARSVTFGLNLTF